MKTLAKNCMTLAVTSFDRSVMAQVDVHCNWQVDPSGAGVCGIASKVFSAEAKEWRAQIWFKRGQKRRAEIHAFMAQSDSASGSEPEGSGFESR